MRRPILHRVASSLVAGFALAALAFAWLAGYDSTAPRATGFSARAADAGAALFALRCARCHSAAEAAAPLASAADRAAGQRALREFLAGHGYAAAAEHGPIVDFLATLPPAAADERAASEDDFEL